MMATSVDRKFKGWGDGIVVGTFCMKSHTGGEFSLCSDFFIT